LIFRVSCKTEENLSLLRKQVLLCLTEELTNLELKQTYRESQVPAGNPEAANSLPSTFSHSHMALTKKKNTKQN